MNKWELGVLRQKTTVGVKVVRGLTLTVHAMYSEFTATGDGAEKEKGGEDCRGCKQSYILSWWELGDDKKCLQRNLSLVQLPKVFVFTGQGYFLFKNDMYM